MKGRAAVGIAAEPQPSLVQLDERAADRQADAQARFVSREASLTPREREVLGFVIQGIYNKNIADRIGLSIKTVELYRARGLAKMHARFRAREASLTPREREVMGHVVHGIYNKNIADRMGLSIKTVELYRARGMAKMQARSVAELTRMMVSRQA